MKMLNLPVLRNDFTMQNAIDEIDDEISAYSKKYLNLDPPTVIDLFHSPALEPDDESQIIKSRVDLRSAPKQANRELMLEIKAAYLHVKKCREHLSDEKDGLALRELVGAACGLGRISAYERVNGLERITSERIERNRKNATPARNEKIMDWLVKNIERLALQDRKNLLIAVNALRSPLAEYAKSIGATAKWISDDPYKKIHNWTTNNPEFKNKIQNSLKFDTSRA